MSPAFLALLVYIGFEYIRPEVLFPTLIGVPILRIVAIIVTVLFGIEHFLKRRPLVHAPQNLFLLAFLFWLPVTNLFSGGQMLWYAKHSFLEFGKIVIIYFIIVNLIDSEKRLRVFLTVLIMLTTYLAIGAVAQSVYHKDFPGFHVENQLSGSVEAVEDEEEERISYSGIFADSNDFAQISLVGLAILINFVPTIPSVVVRQVLRAVSLLMITIVLLTMSRGGFLGLVALFFLTIRRRYGNVVGLLFLIAGLTVVLFSSSVLSSRLGTLSPNEASAHGRIEAWTEGWDLFWANPIFGIGHTFFQEFASRAAHNSMVLVGTETGFVGLYLWLGFIYLTYQQIFEFRRQNVDLRLQYYINGISDALTVFLVTAFFLSRSYIFVMYFIIAMAVSLFRVGNFRTDLRAPDLIKIGLCVIGCIVVWKISLVAGWNM